MRSTYQMWQDFPVARHLRNRENRYVDTEPTRAGRVGRKLLEEVWADAFHGK